MLWTHPKCYDYFTDKRNVAIISSHFSMAPLFKSSLSCAVLPLFNGPWRPCPVASWWPCVAVAAAGRAELLTGPTLACACAQAKSRTALDADVVTSPQSAKLKRHHSVAKERTEIWWDLMRISHWLIDMSSHTGDKYCYTVTRRHRDAYLIWQESRKKQNGTLRKEPSSRFGLRMQSHDLWPSMKLGQAYGILRSQPCFSAWLWVQRAEVHWGNQLDWSTRYFATTLSRYSKTAFNHTTWRGL